MLGAVGVQRTAPLSIKHGRYRGAVWGEAVSSGWGSSLGDRVTGTDFIFHVLASYFCFQRCLTFRLAVVWAQETHKGNQCWSSFLQIVPF